MHYLILIVNEFEILLISQKTNGIFSGSEKHYSGKKTRPADKECNDTVWAGCCQ